MTVLDVNLEDLRIVGSVPCGAPEHPFFDIDESECEHLYKYARLHPRMTYIITAKGDSMVNANIEDGDILWIDCSQDYFQDGKIALVEFNGNRTLKRLHLQVKTNSNRILLVAENPRYQPIVVTDEDNFKIIGTLRYVMKGK